MEKVTADDIITAVDQANISYECEFYYADDAEARIAELEALLDDVLSYMTGGVWHHKQSPDMVIKAALRREG